MVQDWGRPGQQEGKLQSKLEPETRCKKGQKYPGNRLDGCVQEKYGEGSKYDPAVYSVVLGLSRLPSSGCLPFDTTTADWAD